MSKIGQTYPFVATRVCFKHMSEAFLFFSVGLCAPTQSCITERAPLSGYAMLMRLRGNVSQNIGQRWMNTNFTKGQGESAFPIHLLRTFLIAVFFGQTAVGSMT